jgi:hypothetical protein
LPRKLSVNVYTKGVTHVSNIAEDFVGNCGIGCEIRIDRIVEQKYFVGFSKRIDVEIGLEKPLKHFGYRNRLQHTFDINIVQVVDGKIQIGVRVFRELSVTKHERLLKERRRNNIEQVVYIECVDASLLNEVDGSLGLEWGHAEIAVNLSLSRDKALPLYFLHKLAQNVNETLGSIKMLFVFHDSVFSEFQFYIVGVSRYVN